MNRRLITKGKLLVPFLLLACMLTGCMGEKMSIQIQPDGTCMYSLQYLYEQSFFDSMIDQNQQGHIMTSGDFTSSTVSENGKTYQAFSRTLTFASTEEMKQCLTNSASYVKKLQEGSKNPSSYTQDAVTAPLISATITRDTFIAKAYEDTTSLTEDTGGPDDANDLDLGNSPDINAYLKELGVIANFSITLPEVISESNGDKNGQTATWTMDNLPDDGTLIAVSGNNPIISSDHESPVLTGAKKGGIYRKVTIQATDNVSVAQITLNGTHYPSTQFALTKDGKYTIAATDANHNTTTIALIIDTKAPVIKGVRNGKKYRKPVRLSFRDANGVKRIKINGKSCKKKNLILKKKGKYHVKVSDQAGNVCKRIFTIK